MMKFKNGLTIIVFLLFGCEASQDLRLANKTTSAAIKKLSSENEIIDSKLRVFFLKRSSQYNASVKSGKDTFRYKDTIEIWNKKRLIKKIAILGDYDSPALTEDITPYISLWKTYHANGNIKAKGLQSWLGFYMDKQYLFDDRGNVIKIKDWDEGYQFNFDDVLKFCRKKKIVLNKYSRGARCRIEKNNFHGDSVWSITGYYPGFPQDVKWVTIILNGKTGEIMQIGLAKVNAE